MIGYTREELLEMDYPKIVHPDFRKMVTERGLARQQGEMVPSRYEVKLLTKTGEEPWVNASAAVVEFEAEQAWGNAGHPHFALKANTRPESHN